MGAHSSLGARGLQKYRHDLGSHLAHGRHDGAAGDAVRVVIVAAAVLPMIMDTAPPPQLNDFRIVTAEERNAPAPVAVPTSVPAVSEPATPAPPVAQSELKTVDATAPAKPTESVPAAPVVVAAVAQQVPLHKRGTDIDARMDLTITTAQNRLIGSVDSQSTYADRPSNVGVLSVLCLWGTTKAFWKYRSTFYPFML